MKILIVYYSTYGHVHHMAEAIAEGASLIDGAEVVLRRVPETLPAEVLDNMGAADAQKAFAHVPVATVDELTTADAVIFGTPPDSATCAARCVSSWMPPASYGRPGPWSAKSATISLDVKSFNCLNVKVPPLRIKSSSAKKIRRATRS